MFGISWLTCAGDLTLTTNQNPARSLRIAFDAPKIWADDNVTSFMQTHNRRLIKSYRCSFSVCGTVGDSSDLRKPDDDDDVGSSDDVCVSPPRSPHFQHLRETRAIQITFNKQTEIMFSLLKPRDEFTMRPLKVSSRCPAAHRDGCRTATPKHDIISLFRSIQKLICQATMGALCGSLIGKVTLMDFWRSRVTVMVTGFVFMRNVRLTRM